jgi:hypothetical protein
MKLFDASKWELVDEQTLANPSQLANYQCPILLTQQVLAIYIDTPNKKPNWHRAGWCRQLVGTGLIDANYDWRVFAKPLILGRNVIIFPHSQTSYNLQINFVSYLKPVYVSIWQFTGEIEGELSTLGEIGQVIGDVATLTGDVVKIAEQVTNLINLVR